MVVGLGLEPLVGLGLLVRILGLRLGRTHDRECSRQIGCCAAFAVNSLDSHVRHRADFITS